MKLPAGLKKRLQASIESLTPLEAGRLYAIYAGEWHKKGTPGSLVDYAPVRDLERAFDDRVTKARGKPNEREAVDAYNALHYLSHLYSAANNEFLTWAIGAVGDAYQVMSRVNLLYLQDATAEIARNAKDIIGNELPKPVSPGDYAALIHWSKTDNLFDLGDAAWAIIDAAHNGDPVDPDRPFAVNASDEEVDAVFDALVAKLKAGELVGGSAFVTPAFWAPVLVVDGTFPAWAALLLAWQRYVTGRGLRGYINADFNEKAGGLAARIVDAEGKPLDDDALRKLAADFYRDCRRRPWGKGLKADPGDPGTLSYFLLRAPDELTHVTAPDWGRADWEAFAKVEVDSRGDPFGLSQAATVGSLDALDADFRHGATFAMTDTIQERNYPLPTSARAYKDIAHVFKLLNILDKAGQPFTYDRREEGMLTMAELTGFKVLTPLEKEVENFRNVRDHIASVRHAFKTVADRYFGGLDILDPEAVAHFKGAEDYLETAAGNLAQWREKLKKWPYEIEADDLDPGEVEILQEVVDKVVSLCLTEARYTSKVKNADEILFGQQGRLL